MYVKPLLCSKTSLNPCFMSNGRISSIASTGSSISISTRVFPNNMFLWISFNICFPNAPTSVNELVLSISINFNANDIFVTSTAMAS